MKKLEDIPKKQNFEVPEGYFEKLPGIIQSRVTQQHKEKSWGFDAPLRTSLCPAVNSPGGRDILVYPFADGEKRGKYSGFRSN